MSEEYRNMETIDQPARDMAQAAMAKIEAHEDVCAQRWREAHNTMGRVETALEKLSKAISGLYNRMWLAAVGVIGALIGLVYFLAERAVP